MPIRLTCPNGHLLETADEFAGKKVRCSICQAIADVPPAVSMPAPRVESAPPRLEPPPANLAPTQTAPPLPQSTDSADFRPRPLFTPVAPPLPAQPTHSEGRDNLEVISPEVIDEDEDVVVAQVIAPPPVHGAPDHHIAPRAREEALDFGEAPLRSRHDYRDDEWEGRLRRRRRDGADDDERRKKKLRRKQRRDSRAMKLVRLGLGFHAAKVLAWLLSILMFMILIVMGVMVGVSMAAQGPQGARDSGALDAAQGIAVLFAGVMLILFLLAPVLGITGSILCCFVPSKTRARPLIFTSLILDGVPIVLGAVALFLGALAAQAGLAGLGKLGLALFLLAFATNVAAFVLFVLFLKAVASFYGDRGTGNEAVHVMIHLFVIAFGGLAFIFGASFILRFVLILGPALQLALIIAWIILIIKIIIRLFNVIQTARALIG